MLNRPPPENVAHLVSATDCRLALTKPGSLPGESDGGAKVVVVLVPCGDFRVRGIGTNEYQMSQVPALSGFHPIVKPTSGIPKSASPPPTGIAVKPSRPRAHRSNPIATQIERQISADLPIVFKEDGNFLLIHLANSLNGRPIVGERVEVLSRTEPIELGHLAERARQEGQEAPHCDVVSRGGRALKPRDTRGVDAHDWSKRSFTAEGARIGAPIVAIDVVPESRSGKTEFAATFESVCSFRPCHGIAVGVERGAFRNIAVEQRVCFSAKLGCPPHTQIIWVVATGFMPSWGRTGIPPTAGKNPSASSLVSGLAGPCLLVPVRRIPHRASLIRARRKGRREIDRQNLRLPLRRCRHNRSARRELLVCLDLFKTPASANLVFRIEIVIEFDVELLPDVGRAKAKTILPAPRALHPAGSRGVQAFADFPIVNCRHDA